MRILLVEDNRVLAAGFAKHMTKHGLTVDVCETAEEALAATETVAYDVVLLDLGLPDADGTVVLSRLRERRSSVPLLVITARATIRDRIASLNAGADDYLVKPFDLDELVARVHALARRGRFSIEAGLKCGNLAFDASSREAVVEGKRVSLRRREAALLETLLRRQGNAVNKDALQASVYGFEEEIGSNSIEVHIHRLRRCLMEAGATANITTIRGLGYALREQDT
jgi:DNA-binding response OmpR family regulator